MIFQSFAPLRTVHPTLFMPTFTHTSNFLFQAAALANMGGRSLQVTLKRMFPLLMTTAIERQFSLEKPREGKKAFKPLQLFRVVCSKLLYKVNKSCIGILSPDDHKLIYLVFVCHLRNMVITIMVIGLNDRTYFARSAFTHLGIWQKLYSY